MTLLNVTRTTCIACLSELFVPVDPLVKRGATPEYVCDVACYRAALGLFPIIPESIIEVFPYPPLPILRLVRRAPTAKEMRVLKYVTRHRHREEN